MHVLTTAPHPLSPQVHGPRLLRYSRDGLRDNTIYTTLPPPSQHNPFTVAVSMALDYADGFGCGCDGEPAFFELRAPPPPQSHVPNTTLWPNSINTTNATTLNQTEGAVVGTRLNGSALNQTEGAVVGTRLNGSALNGSAAPPPLAPPGVLTTVPGVPVSSRCIARPSSRTVTSAHYGAHPSPQVHRPPIQPDKHERAAAAAAPFAPAAAARSVDQLHQIRQRYECELGDGDHWERDRGGGGERDEHHVSTRCAALAATWVGARRYALMTS